MLPVRDNNPTRGTAYVTVLLIIINAGVFLFQMSAGSSSIDSLQFGFMPAQLLKSEAEFEQGLASEFQMPVTDGSGRQLFYALTGRPVSQPNVIAINLAKSAPASVKLFTCMFLHGGWMHLIGNMLFLWIFGNYIEDRLGPLLFILFYLATGICGTLTHAFFDPGYVPLVGASGAISGVMGAYLVLAPRARIQAITLLGYVPITVNLPAWVYMIFYIVIQNLYPATFSFGEGGVAHWAHLGGVAAGIALIFVFPKRKALPVVNSAVDVEDADIVI